MTLRLRLVVGLVILVLTGLAIFGVSTYTLYSRTQYDRLDDELRNSIASALCGLIAEAEPGFPACPGGGRGGPTAPPGTYAALFTVDGEALASSDGSDLEYTFPQRSSQASSAKPSLPAISDPGLH